MKFNKFNVNYLMMFIILILFACVGYILSAMSLQRKDSFFCTSSFTQHSSNDTLKLSINFNLNHGDGYVTMAGIFYQNGLKKSDISLHKEFLYTQTDGEFTFTQKKDGVLELNNSDPTVLNKYLPDFYSTNTAAAHHVRIKTIRPGVWIFTTNPTPYMVCTEY